MITTQRNYESLYLLDAALTDEQVNSVVERYSNLIADLGGEVQAAGRWDKRRLAYEVKGRREGIYILMYFVGEPAVSKELDRNFRISDDVLRHIIVRVEPEHIDTSRIGQPLSGEEETAASAAEEPAAEGSEALDAAPAEQAEAAVEAEPAAQETAEQTAEAEEPPAEEEQSG